LRRSFFRDKIEAVETMSAEQQEKNLDQLISQLNALVPPEKSAADKAELSEPNAAPMEPAVEAPDPAIQQAPAEEVQPEAKTVADPNLTIDPLLVKLEKVEEIVDPLLLADTLFRKGYHPKAYEYYQQAAERIPAEDIENTQWALFQLANSCARTDPAQAIKHYTELLTRFPNSPWSGSALSQKTTLEWTMNETLNKYVSGR
jgi:tetratricopeptide (TPR) repeat protein